MRLLAVETATDLVGAAVLADDGSVAERSHLGGRAHAELLAPMIEEVCALAGCPLGDIEALAVDVGPGLFTGLRVGVATAKALGQALALGVVPVTSLDVLAEGARRCAGVGRGARVVAVVDARRGEVFAAAWDAHAAATPGPGAALLEPAPMAPVELAQRAVWLGKRRLIVGDGAVAFRQVLEGSGTVIPGDHSNLHRVDATYHCRLAQQAQPTGADDVVPEYLRVPDAELTLQASQPR